jgi:acyl-CoA thioesterase
MADTYGSKGLMEVVAGVRKPPNCDITLQIDPVYAEGGVARGVWTIDEKLVNGNGVCMGGYLAAAVDTMMAYAIASSLAEDRTFSTIDLHTTFHRPALAGIAEVEARVERLGKNVVYLVADITQNGKKVTSAVSSMLIMGDMT